MQGKQTPVAPANGSKQAGSKVVFLIAALGGLSLLSWLVIFSRNDTRHMTPQDVGLPPPQQNHQQKTSTSAFYVPSGNPSPSSVTKQQTNGDPSQKKRKAPNIVP